ncbi:hypothetical protein ACN94_11730 [Gordonia paraffinivorans]|nr:hypothetical protein [Gordonia paraffinivorans]
MEPSTPLRINDVAGVASFGQSSGRHRVGSASDDDGVGVGMRERDAEPGDVDVDDAVGTRDDSAGEAWSSAGINEHALVAANTAATPADNNQRSVPAPCRRGAATTSRRSARGPLPRATRRI